MSRICESQGKRDTTNSIGGLTIPSSENKDRHEDRGPNQLE